MKKTTLFFILIATLANAQTIRNYSNEFLNIGVDAAAFGVGKAVVSTTNDVNSIYWNPAGLVNVKDTQVSMMHAEYFKGIAKYDYVAYAKAIDTSSTIALSLIRFSVDDILNTTQLIDNNGDIDFNRVSKFNASDMAFHFAYAKYRLLKNFDVGFNGKIIHRRIGKFANSWGFGLDVGFKYVIGKYKLGLMVRDVTTTFNAWSIDSDAFASISNAIPGQNQEEPETLELTKPKAQFGIARVFKFGKNYKLTSAIDLNMRFHKTTDLIATDFVSVNPAIGLQLAYIDLIYLRAGAHNLSSYTNFDESKSLSVEPNFGIGFKYNGIQIDYALTNIGGLSGTLYSNIFSVKVDFGAFK